MTKKECLLFELTELDRTQRIIFLGKLRELLTKRLGRTSLDFDLLLAGDDELETALAYAKRKA